MTKYIGPRYGWWLYSIVNVVNATEFWTLRWLFYIILILIFFKWEKWQFKSLIWSNPLMISQPTYGKKKKKVNMMPCKEATQFALLSSLSGLCILLSSFFRFIPVSLPFLKHSGMRPTRVLNLWFPLPGMLFLQVSEWFTSSLLWNSAQLLLLKWVFCLFFLLASVQLHTLTQSTACSLLSSFSFLQDLSSSSTSYILFYFIPFQNIKSMSTGPKPVAGTL